jgi:hypothetical protein
MQQDAAFDRHDQLFDEGTNGASKEMAAIILGTPDRAGLV